MNPNPVNSPIIFFILVTMVILTSGCINYTSQQHGIQQNTTSVPVPTTPVKVIEKFLSVDQASEIIRMFILPQKVDNLTYVKTINKTNTTLYEFKTSTASFVVNPTTGRVQSAKWAGSGPVISGITGDINQSCKLVREYAKEKYPEIWVSDDFRDMNSNSAKIWPLSIDTKYECAWFETLYYPDKKTTPHYTIRDRNSITIVIDPSTEMIHSYEETYTPLQPSLNLQPMLAEDQVWEFAKQYFAKKGIINIQFSEQKNYGLFITSDENGEQYLIYSLIVEQYRNHISYGGLIGIDAHDGHVVYFTTF
jgi:hypothetical protein